TRSSDRSPPVSTSRRRSPPPAPCDRRPRTGPDARISTSMSGRPAVGGKAARPDRRRFASRSRDRAWPPLGWEPKLDERYRRVEFEEATVVTERAAVPGGKAASTGTQAPGSEAVSVGPPTGRRMRARLARFNAPWQSSTLPEVLEPLVAAHRSSHPRADVRLLQQAYTRADLLHDGQFRKSGDPYITHPLAVASILAELGMDTNTLVAALLHDTVE